MRAPLLLMTGLHMLVQVLGDFISWGQVVLALLVARRLAT
jgi:hypothetical protein